MHMVKPIRTPWPAPPAGGAGQSGGGRHGGDELILVSAQRLRRAFYLLRDASERSPSRKVRDAMDILRAELRL